MRVGLDVHVGDVAFDGAHAEDERFADLAAASPTRNEAEYFDFAFREAVRIGRGLVAQGGLLECVNAFEPRFARATPGVDRQGGCETLRCFVAVMAPGACKNLAPEQ